MKLEIKEDKKVTLTIVIVGKPAGDFSFSVSRKIKSIISQLLEKTQNIGQNAEDWVACLEDGSVLNKDSTIDDLNLKEGTVILLRPERGEGGSNWSVIK
jgi:hypothetical protein